MAENWPYTPALYILGRVSPRTFRTLGGLQVLLSPSFPSTGSLFRASVLRTPEIGFFLGLYG